MRERDLGAVLLHIGDDNLIGYRLERLVQAGNELRIPLDLFKKFRGAVLPEKIDQPIIVQGLDIPDDQVVDRAFAQGTLGPALQFPGLGILRIQAEDPVQPRQTIGIAP